MNGHTQEPWKADGGYISGADGLCMANTMANPEADAARIVACVNAFAGLDETSIIEDMLAGGFSVRGLSQYAKGLEQQRDELLSALKVIRGAAKNANSFRDLQMVAHEAIAKSEDR